ncbi:MAG: hypothetical protein HYW34_02280 [Candidatus Brennerbacteria bacterium]|nr:hypothetical protein [Candidatus Brennerbacteria bacterium]
MNWHFILTAGHIIGTVLGVGGATFAEIFYLKSARDGIIDQTESGFLKTTYFIMRLGMIILLFSGFGYLIWYRFTGQEALMYNPRFWAKMTVVLTIVINALLLQAKKISLNAGSAVSLTSWYGAMILGSWRGLEAGYLQILIFYTASVIAVYFILKTIKNKIKTK